jgi:hypothetical protein
MGLKIRPFSISPARRTESSFGAIPRCLEISPELWHGLPPLLEKVGVSLGAIEDEIKRVMIESDLCALCRHGKSSRSSRARESFDRPVVNETLRIRLSVLEHERELGKAGGDEQH